MKKIFSGLVVLFFLLMIPSVTYPLNGIQVIGIGAIHVALGGAGVARPLDSTATYLNPAGMNRVGNRVDLSFSMGFPNTKMDTSTVPAPLGNPAAVNIKSQSDPSLLPSGSFIYTFGKKDRFALGLATGLTAAFGVDFPVSRFNSAVTGDTWDNHSRYGLIKIVPGFSWQILDELAVGVGLHVNYAFHQTNSITMAGAETQGRGVIDTAFGVGGSIGILYQPLDWFSTGVTYSTRQYFQRFGRYRDLYASSWDIPQQVAVGVAFDPFTGALLLLDFRWIDWSSISILGNPVAVGGFGWRDQFIFATGFQYDFGEKFKVPLAIRLGYNYGRSPITSEDVYTNILVATVTEHHLSAGLSFQVNKTLGLHAAYLHDFGKTFIDNGQGNPAAVGARVSNSINAFVTQISINY